MTWWWLRRHRRHGQVILRLANAGPITVVAGSTATVHAVTAGREPGEVVDGVLYLGSVVLVPEYACPCGKTRPR